ncbi:hypothetical protein KC675_01725 [Candidatus Dojkabacteria bacterium]|jgi:hypothetical protein|uniref:Uncharacterized protein n=1 Tax=Candidatus Dojkabacteria bacterium TaxID=2099670 RepID=A0A955KZD9_9BACT|nr:hypothetical protein [Candidatus Dojkabacteria bacterium]
MSKYINNLKEIVERKTIDSNTISSMFSNIRNVIDDNGTKSKYKLLYFFCDWSSHINVDRSIFCRDLLDALSDVWLIYKGKEGVTDKEIIYAFNKSVFSFKILRNELIMFFNEHRVDNAMFTSDSEWKNLSSVILYHLSGRPIMRNPKYKYKLPSEDYVVSFSIVNPIDEEDDILKMIATIENTFHFRIMTKNKLIIVGIFYIY